MRLVRNERISVSSRDSISLEKQHTLIAAHCDIHGHEIIGDAIDDGVSGTVNPFERPGLGPWLTPERMAEYDGIIVLKVDRLSRRLLHFAALLKWAEDNGKCIIAVQDPIDTSTTVGKMIAQMIALVAEWEVETMRDRIRGTKEKLRGTVRFVGGKVPYGYWVEPIPDGGKRLVIDPYSAGVLRRIVEAVLEGKRPSELRDELNAEGVLAPTDYARMMRDRETLGSRWSTQGLTDMLRSRTLIGQAEHAPKAAYATSGRRRARQVIRGADGMPLQRAEPLIGPETYLRLQARLDTLSRPQLSRHLKGMAAGIVACGGCGRNMCKQVQNSHSYYRCMSRSNGRACTNAAGVRAATLDEALALHVLKVLGNAERAERVWIPGEDYGVELETVSRTMAELREEWDIGLYSGNREGYLDRMTKLKARHDKLSEMPSSIGHYSYIGMGETFGQAWIRMNDASKRDLLVSAGVEAMVTREDIAKRGTRKSAAHTLEVRIPLEVVSRAQNMNVTGPSEAVHIIRERI